MAKLSEPLWKTMPIQYLVLSKFPELVAFARENILTNYEDMRGVKDESERYRKQLEELPEEEIDQLVAKAREDEKKRYQAFREKEERERWFNQPEAEADFAYWVSASYWTPDEAVLLLLGRDPRRVSSKALSSLVAVSPFAKSFADHRELVQRAIVMGQLYERSIPAYFLAWAERFKLEIPVRLKEAIENFGLQIADWKTITDQKQEEISQLEERLQVAENGASESLAEANERILELETQIAGYTNTSALNRERQSLLRLVIGMAIAGYGYDPKASRTSTAREICGDLQLRGLTLDEDTIRKYLNEAKEQLPADWEE